MRIETTLAEHTAWLRARAIVAELQTRAAAEHHTLAAPIVNRCEGRAFAFVLAYAHATNQTVAAAENEIYAAVAEENN